MPFPFDDEGVSTRGVSCIEEGVCRSFLHDSATALREDVPSTGHALPMPNTFGPWARHLVVSAGESSLDELIAGCERRSLRDPALVRARRPPAPDRDHRDDP